MEENAARKLVSSLSYEEKIALMKMLERLQEDKKALNKMSKQGD